MFELNGIRLVCMFFVLALMCLSLWNTERFDDYTTNKNYNHSVAARVASLKGKHEYKCLTEICKNRARIIQSNTGNLKNVGSDSAKAIAKTEAQTELEKAKQEQNKEIIGASSQNANSLTLTTSGKMESSGKYAASTGSQVTDEKIRDLATRINTLENRI